MMARAPGLFDVDARLRELSAKGDDLERVNALVDFEAFRPELKQAVPRADRAKGGRPPYDHVLMFRILILQASHSLSDERTEYLVKDRLSFMRFLGLSLADRVPDANSIWNFREALTRATIGGVPAIEALFRRFEAQLSAAGYIAMGGQIVDATVVAAPKQRNTEEEKRALKEGRIPEAWAAKPARLAQKVAEAQQILNMILALGCTLPGELGVFAVEGRQAELLEVVLEQHLRRVVHLAVPDIRLM
jgi:transposase, IS5 family